MDAGRVVDASRSEKGSEPENTSDPIGSSRLPHFFISTSIPCFPPQSCSCCGITVHYLCSRPFAHVERNEDISWPSPTCGRDGVGDMLLIVETTAETDREAKAVLGPSL